MVRRSLAAAPPERQLTPPDVQTGGRMCGPGGRTCADGVDAARPEVHQMCTACVQSDAQEAAGCDHVTGVEALVVNGKAPWTASTE